MSSEETGTDETSHSENQSKLIWSVLFVLIGYPLSSGPAVFLIVKIHSVSRATAEAINILYMPTFWLGYLISEDLLRIWIEFWAGLAER